MRSGARVLTLVLLAGASPAIAAPSATGWLGAARALPPPAAPGSSAPRFAEGPDGHTWLSWIEPRAGGGHRLRCAALRGDRWSSALTIAEGDSLFVNWADCPGLIALSDGRLAAFWMWKTGDRHTYEVRISTSRDGGRTWSRPVRAHQDTSRAEHGFVSMVPDGKDVRLVWLDGRNAAGRPEGEWDMELRSARLTAEGGVADERVLDPRVCDCCQTAAAAVSGGIVVAYRDRSAAEVRDISAVRFSESSWSDPHTLSPDGWSIPGCPVNGPSIAASGEHVVAAWYTAEGDQPTVKAAFSSDGGSTFGQPIGLDRTSPLGRVQTALLPDGSALALWLGVEGEEGLVRVARVTAGGLSGEPITLARVSGSRASGVPRLAIAGGRAFFGWTETSPPARPGERPAPKGLRVEARSLR